MFAEWSIAEPLGVLLYLRAKALFAAHQVLGLECPHGCANLTGFEGHHRVARGLLIAGIDQRIEGQWILIRCYHGLLHETSNYTRLVWCQFNAQFNLPALKNGVRMWCVLPGWQIAPRLVSTQRGGFCIVAVKPCLLGCEIVPMEIVEAPKTLIAMPHFLFVFDVIPGFSRA